VHEHDRLAIALLTDEAAHAAHLELPSSSSVSLDRLRNGAPHNGIIALCGFTVGRGLGPLLRWRGKPL
jgi:hypothetical protein